MSLTDPVVLVRHQRRPDYIEDAWGNEFVVHPVVDAVVLHQTDDSVDRNDGYQVMQDPVWVCAYTGRRFARAVDGVGGMGHWWRPLEGVTTDSDHLWEEAAKSRLRFVLNGEPCTPEDAEAALANGAFGSGAVKGHDLIVTSTVLFDGLHLLCRTCRTDELIGKVPTPARILHASEIHAGSHPLPTDENDRYLMERTT